MDGQKFNGVKVFSATKAKERELLGETITDWLCLHPHCEILEKIVTQSSDSEFHCLAITLFYYDDSLRKGVGNGTTRSSTSKIPATVAQP